MSAETGTLTLEQINGMSREQFVAALGGIFEHSPWVAEGTYQQIPFHSVDELHRAMLQTARSAPDSQVTELLRSHPDLATRLQVTPYSAAEQQGAGLDRLTPEEFELLTGLNAAYTEKFGFPFILAVRGKNKDDIIAAISERVHYPLEQEREQALYQIGRITGFRLHDLLAQPEGSAP
ncbi:2-oxo-4-hydroxy-4-carboxy-5-ureidoimidazoline decarboxylase [Paenibacillus sp. DMB5]|uniref:2-oxo-4-hydroxy-4-carboxy-5-ureidoimidazoline decarboxylase n=1 Tax=Paenibacillus sp. DMB5 TaxID=1780103 RepID=UPI00076BF096|nr:2-oxo-4-hydroxy-4-carboxy-5-ureidoimidazoline decarboxylase [Paenibacillus sp. DMB5]KUP25205.1 OHCU decarboxylase [Paenibacillus sp. DMB5]